MRQDADFRRITRGSQMEVSDVVPWVNEGGRKLLGAEITFDVKPPLHLMNERLPAVISPNEKAPPGTPALYRYALVSASDVTQLNTEVDIRREQTVKIEPGGDRVKVTKLKLIGPPPSSQAYRPEPGY